MLDPSVPCEHCGRTWPFRPLDIGFVWLPAVLICVGCGDHQFSIRPKIGDEVRDGVYVPKDGDRMTCGHCGLLQEVVPDGVRPATAGAVAGDK